MLLVPASLYVFSWVHRVAPAVVAADLMRAFSITAAALGNLAAIYPYVFAAMALVAGGLTDTLGPRWTLALGGATMGLGAALFGGASTFGVAFAGRLLVGLGASVMLIAWLSVAADPRHVRDLHDLHHLPRSLGRAVPDPGVRPHPGSRGDRRLDARGWHRHRLTRGRLAVRPLARPTPAADGGLRGALRRVLDRARAARRRAPAGFVAHPLLPRHGLRGVGARAGVELRPRGQRPRAGRDRDRLLQCADFPRRRSAPVADRRDPRREVGRAHGRRGSPLPARGIPGRLHRLPRPRRGRAGGRAVRHRDALPQRLDTPRLTLALQVLREEREAALPAVLGRLLLVDLRPVVGEERVRGARVEHELDVRVRLLELGLEALDVVRRYPAVGLAVHTEHLRPDARHQAKRVDARRVGVRALDVAVPRHRRGHARVLGAHVERERAAAAEASDAEPVGARPALLLGVVGSDRDVAEVLRPGHFAGDRAHLLEVLPLHPALALVELRRDRVVAGVREAPDHVLVVLTVTGEAGDHDDHGVATRCLRARVVRRDHRRAHVQLAVAGRDSLRVGDDRLRQRDPGGEDATHRRVRAELQDFPAAERIGHTRLLAS